METFDNGLQRQTDDIADAAIGNGHVRVIALKHERYFNALLVGLDEGQAAAACLALRRSGAYCIKLDPGELNNPDAVWRG